MINRKILALACLAFATGPALAAPGGPKYSPPSAVNYCVGLDENGQLFPPGRIRFDVRPENEPQWFLFRYPDGLGQYTRRGTAGLHTPDYRAALEDLGYDFDEVSVQDAYCSRDQELLDRGAAVRIAHLGCPTPFDPGWRDGRRSWSTDQWKTFVMPRWDRGDNRINRVLRINLGPDAELCAAVIVEQIKDAERVCAIGAGFASDPAAGDFELNKAGVCRPSFRGWFRGNLDPAWARPRGRAEIAVPDPETGFYPGRPSTGDLETDLVRR